LIEFVRVPPQRDTAESPVSPFDWKPFFGAAGLDHASFVPAAAEWTPRVYADTRLAWQGPMPNRPDVPLRVEAAAYRGAPVSFKVVGPWSTTSRMAPPQPSTTRRAIAVLGSLVIVLLLAGAVLLVRANLKSGRADRRGAGRIALGLLAVWMCAWLVGARHSFIVDDESNRFLIATAIALLNVGATWLFYLGLEPFVRRLMPDMLIGWTRLLVGHLRDPRVGRDMLVGVATGVLFLLTASAGPVIQILSGSPVTDIRMANMSYFSGTRYAVANMLVVLPNALQSAMVGAFLFVVLLAIVRRQWIAAMLVLLFVCSVILSEMGTAAWPALVVGVVAGGATVAVFLRFGLLALATALAVNQILQVVPLTLDLTQPHAAVSSLALLAVAGLAVWAFYISRAGEGMFRRLLAPV
jgi:hypothetical protein